MLDAHSAAVTSMVWLDDQRASRQNLGLETGSQMLITASKDKKIRIWQMPVKWLSEGGSNFSEPVEAEESKSPGKQIYVKRESENVFSSLPEREERVQTKAELPFGKGPIKKSATQVQRPPPPIRRESSDDLIGWNK